MIDIKTFADETGILKTEDVLKAGISKPTYYSFLRSNGYEQVMHGVYASPDCLIDEAFILSLRCPAGILSHEEALFHYGLIDREPICHAITVYSGYGIARLKESGVKVYTVKKELLLIGKSNVKTGFGHIVPMYDMERSICDMVRSRRSIEIQDFQTALKIYAKRKNKDLNKLMEYAKLFHVDKLIREYMEVLL